MLKIVLTMMMHNIGELVIASWLSTDDTYKETTMKITGIKLGDK